MAIGLVKRDVDLDDAQLQSLVHQLRHQAQGTNASYADSLRGGLLARLQAELDTDPTIKPQRRRGLQRRLDAAAAESAPRADPSLAWALHHLRPTAVRARTRLRLVLHGLAGPRGQSLAEVESDFHLFRQQAPAGRQRRGRRDGRNSNWGLPQDPATRYALTRLHTDPPARPPQRLIQVHAHALDGYEGLRFGYHPEARRLELLQPDGGIRACRNVPPDLAEALRGSNPAATALAFTRLISRPVYRYPDPDEADRRGWAIRCDACGQFAALEHACPTQRQPLPVAGEIVQYVAPGPGEDSTLRTIDAADIKRLLLAAGHGVEVPVRMTCPGDYPPLPDADGLLTQPDPSIAAGEVDGTATITPAPRSHPTTGDAGRPDRPEIDLGNAKCTCRTYRENGWCRHLRMTRDMLAEHLERDELPTDRIAELAAELDSHDTTNAAAGQLTAQDRILTPVVWSDDNDLPALPPDHSTFNYTDNPQRFADDCRAALEAAESTTRHGRPGPDCGVPYLRDDAIYGYGEHRAFGVELEYTVDRPVPRVGHVDGDNELLQFRLIEHPDGPAEYVTAAGNPPTPVEILNARIGTDLRRAQLTDTALLRGYGAARSDGYVSQIWSHEDDLSVAGEIVSPILSNESRSWREIDAVCRTVTAAGGGPHRTGGHVHIAAADYANNPDRITSLLRFLHAHEDELYRLARNPTIPPRISEWCQPVVPPPALGFAAITQAQRVVQRQSMVNLAPIDHQHPAASHLEFRLFDGSLQPGRIQAQIKLALAISDYAARNPKPTGDPQRWELGAGARRVGHRGAFDASTTARIRGLIDTLFRRDVDKRQMAALWAVSQYQLAPEKGGL